PPGATLPGPGQIAGPNTLFGAGAGMPGQPPSVYGINPHLRKWFRTGYGCGKPAALAAPAGMAYAPATPYTPVMQGTLAFPHHPYARSPRDFFMYDPR